MCTTTIEYDCLHTTTDTKECSTYRTLRQRVKKSQEPSLFSCFRLPPSPPKCPLPPGKRAVFRLCDGCAHKAKTQERLQRKRQEKAREVYNAQKNVQIKERRREERKAAYRCLRCVEERRRPDQMTRAANGGLCCARGLQEFEEMEGREAKPKAKARYDISSKATKSRPGRDERSAMSEQHIRNAATNAVHGYGWSRVPGHDSEFLEKGLVQGYFVTPGADHRVLGAGPPLPTKVYEEPGIDWEQWDSAKQISHGRIPPMPNEPLPVIPLKMSKRNIIRRKPVPCRKPSLQTEAVDKEPVSPMSDVSPIQGSDKQPHLRSVLSNLNRDLADAIDDWTQEPLPSAAPEWKRSKW